MKQPIKKNIVKKVQTKKTTTPKTKLKDKEWIQVNGVSVSKLEFYFIDNFLKKLGIKYIHQWESPIKRVYDFAVLKEDGSIDCLIEVNGQFFHADPRFYDQKKLKYTSQKRQILIDESKKQWALENGLIVFEVWEYDIYNDPKKVLKLLKDRIGSKKKIIENKANKKKK